MDRRGGRLALRSSLLGVLLTATPIFVFSENCFAGGAGGGGGGGSNTAAAATAGQVLTQTQAGSDTQSGFFAAGALPAEINTEGSYYSFFTEGSNFAQQQQKLIATDPALQAKDAVAREYFGKGLFELNSSQTWILTIIQGMLALGDTPDAIKYWFLPQYGIFLPDIHTPSSQSHLGMYVSGDTSNPADWGVAGGGRVVRSSGYRISDSASALARGTTGPSFRDISGSGGIWGSYDASRFLGLGGTQSLVLRGFFDYRQDSTSLGTTPAAAPLIVGNAGSIHGDTYTFGGVADYSSGLSYLRGAAQYNFGQTSESSSLTGGAGSFGTSGYGIDARLGRVFVLFGGNAVPPLGAMPTKAPPRATSSGNIVGLDLSAHVGYIENRSNAFTDTAGFTFGTGRTEFGDVGGRAELFDLLPDYGLMWKAYVAGTVDQRFSYSSSMAIPIQAAVPGGDLVTAQAATTFGGAELGLSARGPGGWTFGVQGFYQASADTTFAGGSAYLKIPFYAAPTVGPRY